MSEIKSMARGTVFNGGSKYLHIIRQANPTDSASDMLRVACDVEGSTILGEKLVSRAQLSADAPYLLEEFARRMLLYQKLLAKKKGNWAKIGYYIEKLQMRSIRLTEIERRLLCVEDQSANPPECTEFYKRILDPLTKLYQNIEQLTTTCFPPLPEGKKELSDLEGERLPKTRKRVQVDHAREETAGEEKFLKRLVGGSEGARSALSHRRSKRARTLLAKDAREMLDYIDPGSGSRVEMEGAERNEDIGAHEEEKKKAEQENSTE